MKETEVQYKIVRQIAKLAEERKGWCRELNLVSWNGNDPKYDIRGWNEDHTKCNKGITLTEMELITLRDALNRM